MPSNIDCIEHARVDAHSAFIVNGLNESRKPQDAERTSNSISSIKMNTYLDVDCELERASLKHSETSHAQNRDGKRSGEPFSYSSKNLFKKKTSCLFYFAKLTKVMFSSVGLVALVFVYSTVGAFMFQILEQHEEIRMCEGKC